YCAVHESLLKINAVHVFFRLCAKFTQVKVVGELPVFKRMEESLNRRYYRIFGWMRRYSQFCRLSYLFAVKRILIVEDDSALSGSIASHLERDGYACVRAYDTHMALKVFQNEEVHLVML